MITKMGLSIVGLFIVAGALTVSCGGSDGGDESNTSGTSSGGSSTAGSNTAGSLTAGTNNKAGGTNNNGGTNSNNGGTNSNNGGTNSNNGGDDGGPGAGLDPCDAAVMDGEECQQGDQACEAANGETCLCFGQGGNPEWTCIDTGGLGEGGAGSGIPMVDCGANPMMGDDCEGFGVCEGSDTCGCFQGAVICGMP